MEKYKQYIDNPDYEFVPYNKSGTNSIEVEGGETTVGDYVFSKKLGFADLHKPIARAKGKIEAKPMTPERVNALRRLKNEERSMVMSQEYFKKQLGVS